MGQILKNIHLVGIILFVLSIASSIFEAFTPSITPDYWFISVYSTIQCISLIIIVSSVERNRLVKIFSIAFWMFEAITVAIFSFENHRTDFGISDNQISDNFLILFFGLGFIALIVSSIFIMLESRILGAIFLLIQILAIVIVANIYFSNVYLISIIGPGLAYFSYYLIRIELFSRNLLV